jgi:putative phage-type endonuclease
MRVVDCEQGTDEWRMARLGKVGASGVADATARTKSGWGASRANLAARLVAERLTGVLSDGFTNDAMRWGTEKEPEARQVYQFVHGVEVKQVGLVLHPSIDMTVASPDGLVGDDGLVEIKCPQTATHIETLLCGEADSRYIKQMQWQMACTGRRWVDWVSYDPRMPGEMQLFVRRVHRDPAMIAELEKQVSEFLGEVADTVERLVKMYRTPMAAE